MSIRLNGRLTPRGRVLWFRVDFWGAAGEGLGPASECRCHNYRQEGKRFEAEGCSAKVAPIAPPGAGCQMAGGRTGMGSSRGLGWGVIHVCTGGGAHRLQPDTALRDQTGAIAFLKAAVACYASFGGYFHTGDEPRQRVLQIRRFKHACNQPGFKHIPTRPCTLKTGGLVERAIQARLGEGGLHPVGDYSTWSTSSKSGCQSCVRKCAKSNS